MSSHSGQSGTKARLAARQRVAWDCVFIVVSAPFAISALVAVAAQLNWSHVKWILFVLSGWHGNRGLHARQRVARGHVIVFASVQWVAVTGIQSSRSRAMATKLVQLGPSGPDQRHVPEHVVVEYDLRRDTA